MTNIFNGWKNYFLLHQVSFSMKIVYIYDKVKWEYLKYEIRKYPVGFSKKLAKNSEIKIADLEIRLIYFEKQ